MPGNAEGNEEESLGSEESYYSDEEDFSEGEDSNYSGEVDDEDIEIYIGRD